MPASSEFVPDHLEAALTSKLNRAFAFSSMITMRITVLAWPEQHHVGKALGKRCLRRLCDDGKEDRRLTMSAERDQPLKCRGGRDGIIITQPQPRRQACIDPAREFIDELAERHGITWRHEGEAGTIRLNAASSRSAATDNDRLVRTMVQASEPSRSLSSLFCNRLRIAAAKPASSFSPTSNPV